MQEMPHWFARRYNSVSARTRETDPDAQFQIRQIHAERHSSRLSTIDVDDVYVLGLHDRGGIAMAGAIHDDALTAVFLWGEGTTFNRQLSDVPRLRVLGPGTEFDLNLPGRYHLMRIGLRAERLDALREASPADSRQRLWQMPGVHEGGFAPGAELGLQQRLLRTTAFAEAAARSGHDFHDALAAAASETGAALMRTLAGTEEPPTQGMQNYSHRRIVDAALTILHGSPYAPVSVSAVCETLGIGERMLQRAFVDRFGMSPRSYERERRLRAAHGLILTDGNQLSITDIAMSFGFWHLGRFAGAYAALFGCSPSETRRRIWGIPTETSSMLPA